jgi:hypothetical protein
MALTAKEKRVLRKIVAMDNQFYIDRMIEYAQKSDAEISTEVADYLEQKQINLNAKIASMQNQLTEGE